MRGALGAPPPVFGAKVKRFDAGAATGVPGVRAVFEIRTGVAAVGDHFWAAKRGRDALRVEWDAGPHAGLDTAKLGQSYREQAKLDGARAASGGDAAKALAAAAERTRLTAEYAVPYLAHAPMEPLNCTVRRTAGGCEVWTGTQFQTVDPQRVAAILGLQPGQVVIHTAFLGGGFGPRGHPGSAFVAGGAHVANGAQRPREPRRNA